MATRRRTLMMAIAELKDTGFLVPKSFNGFKVIVNVETGICSVILLGEILSRDDKYNIFICNVAEAYACDVIPYQLSSDVCTIITFPFSGESS